MKPSSADCRDSRNVFIQGRSASKPSASSRLRNSTTFILPGSTLKSSISTDFASSTQISDCFKGRPLGTAAGRQSGRPFENQAGCSSTEGHRWVVPYFFARLVCNSFTRRAAVASRLLDGVPGSICLVVLYRLSKNVFMLSTVVDVVCISVSG